MSESLVGISAAVLATISWSLAPITIKHGIKATTDLISVTGIRAFTAFLVLLPLTIFRIGEYLPTNYELTLILITGVLIGVSDIFYMEAIKRLGSWKAILIAYQYILIAQILAYLILDEVNGIYATLFTPIALFGIFIALRGSSNNGKSISIKLLLIAYMPAVLWGIATVISRYLTYSVDAVLIASFRSLFIAFIFIPVGFKKLTSLTTLGRRGFTYVLLSGFFTHVGGFLVFLYALRSVGTFISTLVNSMGPLITQLLSRKLSGEELSIRHVVGASITVGSVVLTLVLSSLNII
ncbi:MAG: DMT family transporter [Sulfolobales archaeon]